MRCGIAFMSFDRNTAKLVGSRNLNPNTTDDEPPFISIVIPAYNEASRIGACIAALQNCSELLSYRHEVIVVVEKSTDDTLAIAGQMTAGHGSFKVIGNPDHRGKGHAVRTGMLAARGDIAFFMDADLSTPLKEITPFLARFESVPEVDIIIGNRQHPDSAIVRRQSALRQGLGQCFNFVLRRLTGIRVKDTQCGFKAFRRRARETIFPLQTISGFAFDVELLLLATQLGFRVEDRPVEWRNADGSKVHIVRDSVRMLRDALRVRAAVARTLERAKN